MSSPSEGGKGRLGVSFHLKAPFVSPSRPPSEPLASLLLACLLMTTNCCSRSWSPTKTGGKGHGSASPPVTLTDGGFSSGFKPISLKGNVFFFFYCVCWGSGSPRINEFHIPVPWGSGWISHSGKGCLTSWTLQNR